MILGYFTEFINLTPKKTIKGEGNWTEFATKEEVQQIQSKMQSEVSRFFGDLSTKQPQFVTPIIEEITNGLLHSYYTVRLAMKGLDNKERDKGRPSMLLIFEVICMVIHGAESLKVKYSNEFVDNWRGRVDYFPFDDMPTDAPISKIKQDINQEDVGDLPPPSLDFKVKDVDYKNQCESYFRHIVLGEMNPHHLRYAIMGEEVPKDQRPFEAITVEKRTKSAIYGILKDLEKKEGLITTETLSNGRKVKAGSLFKYSDNKPIGKLSNPKS